MSVTPVCWRRRRHWLILVWILIWSYQLRFVLLMQKKREKGGESMCACVCASVLISILVIWLAKVGVRVTTTSVFRVRALVTNWCYSSSDMLLWSLVIGFRERWDPRSSDPGQWLVLYLGNIIRKQSWSKGNSSTFFCEYCRLRNSFPIFIYLLLYFLLESNFDWFFGLIRELGRLASRFNQYQSLTEPPHNKTRTFPSKLEKPKRSPPHGPTSRHERTNPRTRTKNLRVQPSIWQVLPSYYTSFLETQTSLALFTARSWGVMITKRYSIGIHKVKNKQTNKETPKKEEKKEGKKDVKLAIQQQAAVVAAAVSW